ncbi:MAG: hypothetical protein H6581_07300 [Bacteroidia bacterium]|nr:hypothetical protein [Bacteroidia bacterium]
MKFKSNIITILGLTLVLLLSSSCFDIYEKIHFNQDGSGHAEYKVDMSKMVSMIDMMSGLDEDKEEGESEEGDEEGEGEDSKESFDESMAETMTETMERLRNIPGISNVKQIEGERGVYGWSYDFAYIEALNVAAGEGNGTDLGGMGMGNLNMNAGTKALFVQKGKKLIRQFAEIDDTKDGSSDEDMESVKFMFKEAQFYMDYTFDAPVKNIKVKPKKDINHSISGKQVKFQFSFLDALESKGKDVYTISTK